MRIPTYLALGVLAVIGAAGVISGERVKVNHLRAGPSPKFEVVSLSSELKNAPKSFAPSGDPKDIALAFARSQLKIKDSDYVVKNSYTSKQPKITHVYLKQVVQGIEVTNGDIAVHVDGKGSVIAFGDNFYHNTDGAKRNLWAGQSAPRFVRPRDAFDAVAKHIKKPVDASKITESTRQDADTKKTQYVLKGIDYALADVVAQQSYLQTKDGHLEAAWEFFIDLGENYFNVHVSADGKKILSLNDWVSDASYNVIKVGDNDLGSDKRTIVTDPHDKTASPKTWQDFDGAVTKTTRGNNVEAYVPGSRRNSKPVAQPVSNDLKFDYPVDLTKDPSTYRDAAVTNLFYVNNIMHDIFYRYGFDEAAGNFQKDNYGKGGKGGDHVEANAQDPSGYDNANFFTPPDGERPRMRMYVWTATSPKRDGDFENDIIVHEYTHGISTRLTGGPSNVRCLDDYESGGMGEGWGDFFGVWLRLKAGDKRDKAMSLGDYVYTKGIRTYPYSTDKKVNPTTYGKVYTSGWDEVHSIGEIWANILYEMYWNLVDKLGYSSDFYSADLTKGNTLAVKLVIDGMKLQPCNPTFITARDAILQAEEQNTGKHKCEIWAAFAKRGVGVKAKTDGESKVVEDFSIPDYCTPAKP
ncbi:extracellular elastinolytic metallo proteinase [Syncephalis plumigaleata]|nr:extracellular elastinolytic metallo proteinase [Syncephalis plumigaleata]